MKIILFGASGLVGNAVVAAAKSRGHRVIGTYLKHMPGSAAGWQRMRERQKLDRSIQLDAADQEKVERLVLEEFPDAIINCVGVTSAADVDKDTKLSNKINVVLPSQLAQLSRHLSARYLHLSSDMVFSGQEGNYRSTDMPEPQNSYGYQKLIAEKEVLERAAEYSIVLRIALVTGNSPSGRRSVHERLFEQWAAGERPTLFEDETRQPVAADNVADLLIELAERRDLTGLFHWAGKEALSRYEIGRRILERFELPENLIRKGKRTDNPATTDRPGDLSMELRPLLGKTKLQPESFSEQLEKLEVPAPFEDWYRQAVGGATK